MRAQRGVRLWIRIYLPRVGFRKEEPGKSLLEMCDVCRAARLLSTFPSEATKPEVPRQCDVGSPHLLIINGLLLIPFH